jgi:hypothetical protein
MRETAKALFEFVALSGHPDPKSTSVSGSANARLGSIRNSAKFLPQPYDSNPLKPEPRDLRINDGPIRADGCPVEAAQVK